jgi:signal transduction histidine kinase/ligand-binding sensor domain-containing protein/DNA-binding response OmpR family regulator
MNRRIFIHLLIFVFISAKIVGQSDNYQFARLSKSNGLSSDHIQTVFKDSKGFVWVGTLSGLNRFDGYSFRVFKKEPFDTASLIDNSITGIYEDHLGNLLVQTPVGNCIYNSEKERICRTFSYKLGELNININNVVSIYTDKSKNVWYNTNIQGLIRYNVKEKIVKQYLFSPRDTTTVSIANVSDIKQNSKGDFWIMHYNGILEKLDGKTEKIVYRTQFLGQKFGQLNYLFRIFCDSQDNIWIFTNSNSFGVTWFNTKTKVPVYLNTKSARLRINSDIISSILEDDYGNIWIGTDHGGINIIDKNKENVAIVSNNHDEIKSISQNSINCMYKDNLGIIWVGTFKEGLNFYHDRMFVFKNYSNIASDPKSLKFNDVNCFCEDEKGNLLIGTNGGGINYFDRQRNTFSSIRHNPSIPNSLSNDVIVSLYKDSKDNIWVGTFYGGLDLYDGKSFKNYVNIPGQETSLSDNRIWEIFEDSRQNLWIGTLSGGLDLFDRTHNAFLHYSGTNQGAVRSKCIITLAEDYRSNLWAGTSDGLFVMDWSSGKVKGYIHSEQDNSSISNNIITILLRDSRKLMWAGTRDGLNLYNRKSDSFIKFRTENGLPDNTIQGLLEDGNGNLWISTLNGLSMMTVKVDTAGNVTQYSFTNYDEGNGLQGKSFNEGAAYKTSRGELVFGGNNGFNIFNPNDVSHVEINPPVYILGLELLGSKVAVKEKTDHRPILTQSILNTHEIVLKYKENVLSIEFAALSYLDAERIKYRYRLEGFNDKWMYTEGTNRKATYTNLDPGKYSFIVEAFQNEDQPFPNKAQLSILVRPPLWRTKIALVCYVLILFGLLMLFRQFLLVRAHLRFQNQQALLETQRQQELNEIKTRFFTNVSHEFRTPLTLIMTPLERMIRKGDNVEQLPTLTLMYQNARRLLNLVNQLLDFRKMEEQRLSISLDYGNVVKFVNEVYKSFSDIAEAKNITFEYHPVPEQLFMRFDEDKLEKILFNLLSNAFKFTHEKGKISIGLDTIDKDSPENPLDKNLDTLVITISDTGIGISPEKQELVFERFFQSEQPSNILRKGSGIGLSLTKEFVKLHDGIIALESEVDKGSTFYVYLPVNREVSESLIAKTKDIFDSTAVKSVNKSELVQKRSDITILLVEDNEDFRFYLRDNLKSMYSISEAPNGKEAWNMILNELPDIIVSDLLMPEMSGLELCAKVKQDRKTSHIPFLLLTASLTEDFKIEGFQLGADAYLTKPFSFEILESRIRYLIAQRESIRRNYQQNFKIEPGAIGITSLDEKLMTKALKIVEENINDTDFSVEKLSQELGFSRVHLYKKLMSITGKSPIEFIRLVRLKRAAQLLRESQLTISEIAYEVGFNDPRYFSKQFKLEFNVLPSQYKSGNFREEEKDEAE